MKKRIQRVISIGLISLLCFFCLPENILSLIAAEIAANTVDISIQTDETYTLLGSGAAVLNVLDGGVMNGKAELIYEAESTEHKLTVASGGTVNGDITTTVSEDIDDTTYVSDTARLSVVNSGTINGTVRICDSANIESSGTVNTIMSNGLVTLNGGLVRVLQAESGNVAVSEDTSVGTFECAADVALSGSERMCITDSLQFQGAGAGITFQVAKTTLITTEESLNVVFHSKSYTIPAGTSGKTLVDLFGTAPTRTVAMKDFYYGMTPATPVLSHEGAVLQYKEKGAQDSTYATAVPTKVGTYVVKAVFPAGDLYDETAATDEFSISYMPVLDNPITYSGTKGNNGFYMSDVKITAKDGYLVSKEPEGPFSENVTYTSSKDSVTLYFKNASTGAMSDEYKAKGFLIDKTAPVIKGAADGKTYYGDSLKLTIKDKKLKSIKVNGTAETVAARSKTLTLEPGNSEKIYKITAEDEAGNKTKIKITVAQDWMKSGNVPNGKQVRLVKGKAYQFDSGNWKVSGDTTSYSGGQKFYVSDDGEYQFTKE